MSGWVVGPPCYAPLIWGIVLPLMSRSFTAGREDTQGVEETGERGNDLGHFTGNGSDFLL